MTHVTCRLTAKNRDRLRNPALGNRVSAKFTFSIDAGDFRGAQISAMNGGDSTPSSVSPASSASVAGTEPGCRGGRGPVIGRGPCREPLWTADAAEADADTHFPSLAERARASTRHVVRNGLASPTHSAHASFFRPSQSSSPSSRASADRRAKKVSIFIIAKFHYTGPTGPARTFLRPGSPRNSVGSVRVSDKVRAGPRGSGRARVVEFRIFATKGQRPLTRWGGGVVCGTCQQN